MRKILSLMLAVVLMSSVSFGQVGLTRQSSNNIQKMTIGQKGVYTGPVNKAINAEYLNENFDAADLVWSQYNTHPTQAWSVGNPQSSNFSTIDATSANSAIFGYIAADCDEKLYSPAFDASTSTGLSLSFWCGYSGPYMIGGTQAGANGADVRALVSTDNGTSWTQVWSYVDTHVGDEAWLWEEVVVDLQADYGGESSVVVAIQYFGNDGDLAAVDNLVVRDLTPIEAEILSINTVSPALMGMIDITGTVKNNGSTPITSYDVVYTIDGGTASAIYSVTGANIAAGATADFTHDVAADLSTAATYAIEVTISNINEGVDPELGNNVLTKSITTLTELIPRKVLHEVLTASTCGYCPDANEAVDAVTFQTNEDKSTLIKYQVWYPAPGDPYSTEESTERHNYYNPTGVPYFVVDGINEEAGTQYTQAKLDAYALGSAAATVVGTADLAGTEMTANVNFEAFADITGTLVAQIAVIEVQTEQNVGNNGETEFHNVMMKFMPGTDGNALVDFASGDVQNVTLTTDLEGTNIEWLGDVRLVAWLQDNATKEVFQSEYIDVTGDIADAGVISLNTVNSACGLPDDNEIKVTVFNGGTTEISNFEVLYTINGEAGQTMTYTEALAVGASVEITFPETEDFSVIGDYEIVASTNVEGDNWTSNDAKTKMVSNVLPSAVPYAETFTPADFVGWSVENVNEDGRFWNFIEQEAFGHNDNSAFVYLYSATSSADDYLYSTCINLVADSTYRLKFWHRVGVDQGTAYPEKMKVMIGEAQEASAMTETIVDLGQFDNGDYMLSSTSFEVAADGTYYLGFHAYSDANQFYIALDDVQITDVTGVGVNELINTSINFYPNPTTGIVNVSGLNDAQIIVYNVLGEEVINTLNNSASAKIDLSSFNTGNYIIKVIENNNVTTQKIILTK